MTALRAGAVAALATVLGLTVLTVIVRSGLGDAGAGWDTDGFRIGAVLVGLLLSLAGAALGAGAGAWSALRAGDASAQPVLAGAAAGAGAVAVLLPVGAAVADGAGLPAACLLAIAGAAGALGGAVGAVRRRAR